ncbi:hypothetical protein BHU72_01240 [Desulfuribacillus stibiiarsenatis]|uniref:Peptidase S8/S53 domain-containing protein n=1 Tax=Desulfuribacillus stibiiarsenatis TaxID=1390249 RepID=A0A1E5LA31_9FIRM|nr:S8 family peptidase [Desulfuribacillus stibiiarsenatis]OEH86914.1 hypothetical protein BHU72_01240 [Desulfuribacillus stibiiarsenatis]
MKVRFHIPLAIAAFLATTYKPYQKLSKRNRKIIVFRNWHMERELHKSLDYLKHRGAHPIHALPSIRAVTCQFYGNCNKRDLLRDPNILRVDDDIEVTIKPLPFLFPYMHMPITSRTIVPWGVEKVHAPEAWQYATGRGVKVGVIDTGVDLSHPMLVANLRQGINIINPDISPQDDNGHGTHVAGTIAASGGPGSLIGVAPEAELYPVKAFDKHGKALLSDIGKAVEWCVENDIRLINMSFGTSSSNQTLQEIYLQAYERGAVMIAASGNNGPDGAMGYPGRYPFTIAVGATDEEDEIASFSSRGVPVNICAPGVDILSCWLHGGVKRLKGTSMATPHVTGTVALMLERYPQLYFGQIRQVLSATTTKLPGIARTMQGMGLLNTEKAIEMLF